MRIILLTDDNLIEGLIGMVSLAATSYIISHIISAPRSIILGMSFIITWYFRKIGVNLYDYMKEYHKMSISPITYSI